jgi:ankyrin repeat protein
MLRQRTLDSLIASYKGFKQIVKLLLKENVDVNAPDELYGSALHTAAYISHEDIAELLLENSADVNMESVLFGNTL